LISEENAGGVIDIREPVIEIIFDETRLFDLGLTANRDMYDNGFEHPRP
jgi:hypothetical protein